MTTNRIDHTNCTHPRTPAGRKACRAGVPNLAADLVATHADRKARMDKVLGAPVKLTGAVARRMARQAAKAENMRAARCIQAELHTTGRCACGWSA